MVFFLPIRMTEEEKHEAKEQLKTLHQAYSELSKLCTDQTSLTDQVIILIQLCQKNNDDFFTVT